MTDTGVKIMLTKRESGVWPRLIEAANQRLPWLHTDFDRLSPAVLKAMLVAGGETDENNSSEEEEEGWRPRTNVNLIRPPPEEIVNQLHNKLKTPVINHILHFNFNRMCRKLIY